jgi:GLPGLI family protein
MKKITFVASLAIIGFGVSAFVVPNASTDGVAFEGIVTYSINADDPQVAAMAGTSMKEYVKGDKRKIVQEGVFANKMIFMDINKPNEPVVLIDAAGSKYQLKNDTTKKEDDTITPQIKYLDGTKKIAGYSCKKAEMTITLQGQSITSAVYYTEELVSAPIKGGMFKGLKGFPLEYSLSQQGVTITYSATKVSKETLTDDVFKAHTSGYKLMTGEEIQADIQKNMASGN